MVMEADTVTDKHDEERVHNPPLRARAGGEVTDERAPNALDLSVPYTAPAHLVLTPAPECRKLSRGISRATDNEGLVWALRSGAEPDPDALSADHIFLLPDISVYPPDFRAFLEKDLLETSTLVTLESAQILNWWQGVVPGAPRLLPLATSGDGNCLPHAASLAAFGFHDRLLALRSRIQGLLSGEGGMDLTNAIRRRWRWSEATSLRAAGLRLSAGEWEAEWAQSVRAASPRPRPRPGPGAASYSALEQLHVFVLAHVLRRPIIVFADHALRDQSGSPMAPIPFGGVYLPLEAGAGDACSRAAVLLAYDAGHFSALAPTDALRGGAARVPLQHPPGDLMPIRFSVDPGEDFCWDEEPDQKTINKLLPDEYQKSSMLAAYLDLETVECLVPSQPPEELRRSLDALSTKSSKQMNSVAKQFGSIGRSMSSKIKKNFGSMAKLGGKNSQSNQEESLVRSHSTCEVLCCKILAARAPVQEEMVKNYLNEAWISYTTDKSRKECAAQPPRYGTGRSLFYTDSRAPAGTLPSGGTPSSTGTPAPAGTAPGPRDRTLYLCKSTFYDDRPPSPKPCKAPLCMYYGSRENNDYCSRCAKLQ